MEPTEYIVMFPFMAQGHLIPFMELARLFSNRTHLIITLVSTPLNTQNLASLLPPTTTIRLETLPFNSSDHGLPPNSENTDALPSFHYNPRLFHASQTLRPSFEALLADLSRRYGRPPLCVVADVFFGWTVEVARNLGIYHAFFTTCGAYGTAAYFSLWLNLPHTKTDSDEFSVPDFPDKFRLSRSQMSVYMRVADGTDTWSAFFQEQLKYSYLSDGMLCNTVEEMEETGLKILRQMLKIPVWSIGPLLPPSLLQRSSPSAASSLTAGARDRDGKEPGISATHCVEWLNFHPPSSVLYISFGSQNTISATQLMQLALGLEAAGRPFIWVLRPPLGHDAAGEFREEWLPPGFESRASERKQGILVKRWAPQLEILSHQSTGAFISHCGWNSVLESLSQGVPIIGWPLASEQFYNSKMMEEELGVCVEVARGIADEVTSERVERVVEVVLGGREKGEEMKRKAAEIAEIVNASVRDEAGRRGSSVEAVDDFLRTARSKGEGGSHPSIFDKPI